MRSITAIVIFLLSFSLLRAEWNIVEESLPDRDSVKSAVEAVFDLPEDASGTESVTIINPGSLSYLYLSSFGPNVTLTAIVFAHRDDEVQADMAHWEYSQEAPEYVEGEIAYALNEDQESLWKQAVQQHGFSYDEEYLVNYNSANEVAEYQKTLSAVLSKSAEDPSGADLVMELLDNVYEFNWNEASVKKTVE